MQTRFCRMFTCLQVISKEGSHICTWYSHIWNWRTTKIRWDSKVWHLIRSKSTVQIVTEKLRRKIATSCYCFSILRKKAICKQKHKALVKMDQTWPKGELQIPLIIEVAELDSGQDVRRTGSASPLRRFFQNMNDLVVDFWLFFAVFFCVHSFQQTPLWHFFTVACGIAIWNRIEII